MHDASGKLNSGILNGNINQPGDFDQCMGIQQANDDVTSGNNNDDTQANSTLRGQYCLAYAQPVLPHKSKRLQTFFKLLQSHGPFKSEFNDVSAASERERGRERARASIRESSDARSQLHRKKYNLIAGSFILACQNAVLSSA